ncbi:hypothetical protein [Alkalicoccus urumqiensis]|uniref:hypothetical protein n=1 Tax=Alkalicoccus urumqiensis TaxID=1548213 RepID=UPI0015E5C4FF|nr:hypothetical protein [Alkalicoccus urumqiensis]
MMQRRGDFKGFEDRGLVGARLCLEPFVGSGSGAAQGGAGGRWFGFEEVDVFRQ